MLLVPWIYLLLLEMFCLLERRQINYITGTRTDCWPLYSDKWVFLSSCVISGHSYSFFICLSSLGYRGQKGERGEPGIGLPGDPGPAGISGKKSSSTFPDNANIFDKSQSIPKTFILNCWPTLTDWLQFLLLYYLLSHWNARLTWNPRRTWSTGPTWANRKMQPSRLLLSHLSNSTTDSWEMKSCSGDV